MGRGRRRARAAIAYGPVRFSHLPRDGSESGVRDVRSSRSLAAQGIQQPKRRAAPGGLDLYRLASFCITRYKTLVPAGSPNTAGRHRSTGSIPICWKRPELPGPTRRGPPTSPICPWPGDSSTLWPSWTGTVGMWWPGDCPTPWRPISASTP